MKRILVVDDDPAVRNLLTEVLQEHYIVSVATNGEEALNCIRQRRPDGVVLDMMMPIMDGWTFLRARRREPADAQVPVVVVSAEPRACEEGRRLGATACVAKPFDLERLYAAVDQLFTDAPG
ncbi:MAG: response regulator [Chloroflexota bacterium]